ncbi:MAG: hypothetical protein Q9227_004619 [Pyrenula ochraceoflavens]
MASSLAANHETSISYTASQQEKIAHSLRNAEEVESPIPGTSSRDVSGWRWALAGAGMYLGVIMLLSVFTTPTERPLYFAMVGSTFGLGTVLGPIVGGAFADSGASWRWAFYVNLCIGGAFSPVYFLYLPSQDPRPGVSYFKLLGEIDWIGTLLQIGAFTSGIMAISFGGLIFNWSSGQTIGMFVCSGVCFILFGIQQENAIFTTKERRVFPVHYVRNKEMCILFSQIAAASANSFVSFYMIPIFFQFVHGKRALAAGVGLLPYIVPLVFALMLNGALMEKTKYYLPWFTFGGLLIVLSNALLYQIDLETSTAWIYGSLVVGGLGTGLFNNAPFSIAQWIVPPSELALSAGFITCGQVTGVTAALAIANSVFLNLSQNAILKLVPDTPKSTVQGLISGEGGKFFGTLNPTMQQAVSKALVGALSKTFILGLAAGCVAVILSLFMSRSPIKVRLPDEPVMETSEPTGEPDPRSRTLTENPQSVDCGLLSEERATAEPYPHE